MRLSFDNDDMGRSIMEGVTKTMQFILVAVGDVVMEVMGGVDGFLYALIIFVGVECATGIMVGVISKERFSQHWSRVVFKKVMIFFLVALAHIIDNFVIRNGGILRTAVILFYLSTEGISILDNAALIGLPIPKKLKMVLEQMKEEDNK